jgi:hypothetical protein
MQLRKSIAAEDTLPKLATIPVSPGTPAVASPLGSMLPALGVSDIQLKGPTELVISCPFGEQGPVASGVTAEAQAWATNWWVVLVEKQPPLGAAASITMELTAGCTVTGTGTLVMPCALAVTTALPEMGLPELSVPLQAIKKASQTPPHTSPPGETVALVVLEELNVKVGNGVTAPPVGLTAAGVSWTTWPATTETVPGVTLT